MSNKVKIKVDKILRGNFDVDTIESLLIAIREDLSVKLELKEICDLVAHNIRNKGILCDWLKYHSLFKQLEATGQKNFDQDLLPVIIREYILTKFECYDFSVLKEEFGLSSDKNKIRKELKDAFIPNEFVTDALKIKQSASKQILDIIFYLLNSGHSVNYVFSSETLLSQLINYLSMKGYLKNEKEFVKQREKILICLLLIFHGSAYKVNNDQSARAFIATDVKSKVLVIMANILYEEIAGKKNITFVLPLIKTDLKSEEWCVSNLLEILEMKSGHCFAAEKSLSVNEEFKLCLI